MKKKLIILLALTIVSIAFTSNKKEIEFNYPKDKNASFFMMTDKFKKFKKEWRGADYYYMCESGDDGFVCSVLFYKLTNEEKLMYVDHMKVLLDKEVPNFPAISPIYPQAYFTTKSNLAQYESNKSLWGDLKSDFMYSQADILEFNGVKVNQKHMYAYTMFGKDLFVNIHLSKVGCTREDSTVMRQILDGLKIKY